MKTESTSLLGCGEPTLKEQMLHVRGQCRDDSASTPKTTTKSSAQPSATNLISVYRHGNRHAFLYRLLQEREATANISHRKMPSWEDHCAFVDSEPYKAWYFIGTEPLGACYLTKQNEIGVFIFKEHRGKGYAAEAIKAIMKKHGPGRYLANISPWNGASARIFERLGFKMIQHTFEHHN